MDFHSTSHAKMIPLTFLLITSLIITTLVLSICSYFNLFQDSINTVYSCNNLSVLRCVINNPHIASTKGVSLNTIDSFFNISIYYKNNATISFMFLFLILYYYRRKESGWRLLCFCCVSLSLSPPYLLWAWSLGGWTWTLRKDWMLAPLMTAVCNI